MNNASISQILSYLFVLNFANTYYYYNDLGEGATCKGPNGSCLVSLPVVPVLFIFYMITYTMYAYELHPVI